MNMRSPLARGLLLLVLVIAYPAAAADPATKPTTQPALVFPLMGWNHVPNDPAVFKRMRECGLTVAGFVAPAGLDHCHAAGLKAIVSDNRSSNYDWTSVDPAKARAAVTDLVKQVRDHPAVYGYYLRDEPPAGFFPGLAKVAEVVKELHPGTWPYVNLFPNYANAAQLGTPTYEAYLDKFVETCKPPVLSYDHYALHEGGGFTADAYFLNLEQVRRVAVKHDLPFWNIVLAQGCLNFREPTAADFRFQVYTSLAYGARGIAYFQYIAATVGNFRGAPVDQFGNETDAWRWMQNVNLQVGKLGPTLLKLRSNRVYHFGSVPKGSAGPDDQSLVKTAAGNLLVGDFTHEDGSRYVLCVNKDFAKSMPCFPQFREPPKRLEMVSPYSGQLTAFDGEQVWLAPGQGVLLKLGR